MKTLQFNHSIDGSITIRVEDQSVGYINYSDTPIVAMRFFYEEDEFNMLFTSVEEARDFVANHFKEQYNINVG